MKFSDSPAKKQAEARLARAAANNASEQAVVIPISKLLDSPFNEGLPMDDIDELAESINKQGLLNPIIVYDNQDGTYEILSGHRRRNALVRLGKTGALCIIMKKPVSEETRFRQHADANVQTRQKDAPFWISEIEHARNVLESSGFVGTKDRTTQEIGKLIGISKDHVYRYERLAKMKSSASAPVLALEKYGLSPFTLVLAASLDAEQAEEVVARVEDIFAENPEADLPRSKFNSIVNSVRNGAEEPAPTTVPATPVPAPSFMPSPEPVADNTEDEVTNTDNTDDEFIERFSELDGGKRRDTYGESGIQAPMIDERSVVYKEDMPSERSQAAKAEQKSGPNPEAMPGKGNERLGELLRLKEVLMATIKSTAKTGDAETVSELSNFVYELQAELLLFSGTIS